MNLAVSSTAFLEPEAPGKWNDRSIALLQELAKERMTTAQVAAAMSRSTGEKFTRNAIIGKARRLGLPLFGTITLKTKERKPRPVPKKVIKMKPKVSTSDVLPLAKPTPPKLTAVKAAPKCLSILEIKSGECYWPVDVAMFGADIKFCGHPTGGGSWCAAHRQLGYIPPHNRSPKGYRW